MKMSSNSPPEDFAGTVREAVALFRARDPERRRFGARRHDYRFRAPIAAARLAELEAEANVRFPDDYREHLLALGDGGAGPYHGLLPLDHPVQREIARGAFDPADPFHGAVGVGHLGCGYVALLVVDPAHEARSQVWIDVRGAGAGVIPAYPTFRHYVADWISRLAHAEWLPAFVGASACALPNALSAYFHAIEQERGMADGSLAGDELRAALETIADGGIATTHDGTTPFFAAGEPVDLCVACERLIENLGIDRRVIAPGVAPIPGRESESS
jgi:hypothetical protein